MSQSQCVVMMVRLNSECMGHRTNKSVDNCPNICCFVDSYHTKAMVRQVYVELLLRLELQVVEVPWWWEVRRKSAIDTQFIHNHVCPRVNPLWVTRSTAFCVKWFHFNWISKQTKFLRMKRKKTWAKRKLRKTSRLIRSEAEALCTDFNVNEPTQWWMKRKGNVLIHCIDRNLIKIQS